MELNEIDVQWAKDTLRKIDIFCGCSESEFTQLVGGLEKKEYKANSTVLFQGEISCRLCIVKSGKVSINVRKGKDKLKVAELEPNAYFGEISLLMPRAATATVKAEIDSEIVFLPGEVVQALVKNNPSLAGTINKKIQERLDSHKDPEHKSEQGS
ncbi:MAG: cyclic nucleotide-binding domain-containing protein [Endomicrobiales bacterium]|nr:cyclic nucleotide-binding domain-containing protein [Endomicrobiales bacterium]